MLTPCNCLTKWLCSKHVKVGVIGKDKCLLKHILLTKSTKVNNLQSVGPCDCIKMPETPLSSKTLYVGVQQKIFYEIVEIHRMSRWSKYCKKCDYFVGVVCSDVVNHSLISLNKIENECFGKEYFEVCMKKIIFEMEQLFQFSCSKNKIILITDNTLLAAKIMHENHIEGVNVIDIKKKHKILNTLK